MAGMSDLRRLILIISSLRFAICALRYAARYAGAAARAARMPHAIERFIRSMPCWLCPPLMRDDAPYV